MTLGRDQFDEAAEFLGTMRGRYILSRALCVAIDSMSLVPAPHTERSDIADMEFMLDGLFPGFKALHHLEATSPSMATARTAEND